MGTLGGAFPPEYLRQQILRKVRPGLVIKLREVMDDGQVHEKRYIVVKTDENTVCCVINSQIGPFLQARPALLQCQVAMPVADHSFMTHDSHVDCSRTRQFATVHVVRELMRQIDWILGTITPDLRDSIVAALKFAPTLSVKEVADICAALDSVDTGPATGN